MNYRDSFLPHHTPLIQKLDADSQDIAILAAIENGLPLVPQPFAQIGHSLSLSEEAVIERLQKMCDKGIIRRFGLVLQHRSLGYTANAMVVFDIEDHAVDDVAKHIISHDFITLCYCRARQRPQWPYNLYCMIHGQKRKQVERQIAQLKQATRLDNVPSQILFSRQRFKQTGAHFSLPPHHPPVPLSPSSHRKEKPS